MSFKIIGKAFDIPLKSNDKLVLLSLCEYANDDDNTCYPSQATLMRKATVSKTGLNYSLNVLEHLGFIKRKIRYKENGSKTSTLYTVNVDIELDVEYYKKRDTYKIKQSPPLVLKVNYPSPQSELPPSPQSEHKPLVSLTLTSFNPHSKGREGFKKFKERFIKSFQEGDYFNVPELGFRKDTRFIIKQGLIYNTVSNKILDRDEAFKMWSVIYDYSKETNL